jgi:hypothetical protein
MLKGQLSQLPFGQIKQTWFYLQFCSVNKKLWDLLMEYRKNVLLTPYPLMH